MRHPQRVLRLALCVAVAGLGVAVPREAQAATLGPVCPTRDLSGNPLPNSGLYQCAVFRNPGPHGSIYVVGDSVLLGSADAYAAPRPGLGSMLAKAGWGPVVLQATDHEEGLLGEQLGCIAEARAALRVHGMGCAYANRGTAYAVKGDFTRAVADFGAALRMEPQMTALYANRGLAYVKLKDYPSELPDLDKAVAADPKDASALYNRGVARRETGNAAGGDADIAAARAIDPNIGK